jgi:alkylhydroperoxidase/carboxymuconolactone decarboxylase family protein YurZ
MKELGAVLGDEALIRLRGAYRPEQMAAANVTGMGQLFPPLAEWNAQVARTFYADEALRPIDRERSLITLLTYTGPPISLAVHFYWGLMEGLSVDEIGRIVGLVGCYGGLPKCVQGLLVLERLLNLLRGVAASDERAPAAVLEALVRDFQRV